MIIFLKSKQINYINHKKVDCEVNLFLLVCVVVCLIIMNSFTYKYNSFYAKIKIFCLVLNEIKHFKQELIYWYELEYFNWKIIIKLVN